MPIRRCWGADWPLSQSAGKAPARSSPDLKTKRFRKLVVVSPDVGGLKMAYAYSQVLGGGLAIVAKRRKSASEVESMAVIGEIRGKDVLLVDDLTETAGTDR